jgi:2-methylisocitrate lyase-like PEP mutase family enzyme
MNRDQVARAERFHQRHAEPSPLVLPNVWDAASARIVEQAGAEAIATSSAAMAWALGYQDGEQMPVEVLLDACRRIINVVSVPFTVDIERGYGDTASDTGGLVGALIELGAVGINIEDGVVSGTNTLTDPAILSERIACARSVARHRGLPLFINVRIDAYFVAGTDAKTRLEETRTRALAYIAAGADGIFVPGLADLYDIADLASSLPVPLNIYTGYPGATTVADLQRAGVRRISLGCGPMQAAMAHLATIAREALNEGRFDTMGANMLTVGEANALFTPVHRPEPQAARRQAVTSMGDGPVALLLGRPRQVAAHRDDQRRRIELTTRNGTLQMTSNHASLCLEADHGVRQLLTQLVARLFGSTHQGTKPSDR